MSTTYDDNERSVSQNRPIDLYTITTPTVTYRLTSYPVNVSFGGNTYTALTMSRGDLQVTQDTTGRELIVYLPISHPLVQRYTASGIPEHAVTVTWQRLQTVSGVALQYFSGFATGLSVQGHVATLRCPSVTDDALAIKLPVLRAQRLCNHVLFDAYCAPNPGVSGPVKASFQVSTTIVSQTVVPGSVTLVVASIGGNPDGWAAFGDVLHGPTGQRLFILLQIGTTLTLNMPIIGYQVGDAVTVTAGCAHDVLTCKTKYSNVVNFGGFPELNGQINPWAAKGFGIVQQT